MDNRPYSTTQASVGVTYDAGLRAFMNKVYGRMAAGVLATGLIAAFVMSQPALMKFFLGGPQMYIVIFAPLAVIWFGFNPNRMSANQLSVSFFLLAALYGISFSTIGLIFTGESIARAFFVATAMFAGLSIYGYTTRKNLDALGSFAIMGVIGLLVASVINIFIGSSMMQNVIAGVGIVAFAGLTAFYTQQTKEMFSTSYTGEIASRLAWVAALNLYISFIAMFQYILHFMGNRQ
jgi:FtsH-binding integral membrane protein